MKTIVSFLPPSRGPGGGGRGETFVYKPGDNSRLLAWIRARMRVLRADLTEEVDSDFDNSSDASIRWLKESSLKRKDEIEKRLKELEKMSNDPKSDFDPGDEDALFDELDSLSDVIIELHHRRFDIGKNEDKMLAKAGIASNFADCAKQLKAGAKSVTVFMKAK